MNVRYHKKKRKGQVLFSCSPQCYNRREIGHDPDPKRQMPDGCQSCKCYAEIKKSIMDAAFLRQDGGKSKNKEIIRLLVIMTDYASHGLEMKYDLERMSGRHHLRGTVLGNFCRSRFAFDCEVLEVVAFLH